MFLTSATGEGRCVSNGFPDYVGCRVHINAQFITDNYEYYSGTYQCTQFIMNIIWLHINAQFITDDYEYH